MKTVDVKIPVYAILAVIILFIGVIVALSMLSIKNKQISQKNAQITKVQNAYDSVRITTNNIIKEKNDTIAYQKQIIENRDAKIAHQKSKLVNVENILAETKQQVATFTNDSVYVLTQDYLPTPTDSSKFPYSGNQVKDIYSDHLDLLKMHDAVLDYQKYTFELEHGLTDRDSQITNYKDLTNAQKAQLEASGNQINSLSGQNGDLMKKNKRLKIFVPVSGGLGIVIGILIMTL